MYHPIPYEKGKSWRDGGGGLENSNFQKNIILNNNWN